MTFVDPGSRLNIGEKCRNYSRQTALEAAEERGAAQIIAFLKEQEI